MSDLPIDAVLPEIIAALQTQASLVLRAPTGAGKTTRVPPALLKADLAGDEQILVLQPRRIAARATAARMSSEWGDGLGTTFGYQTRFDSKFTSRTRVLCVTEGILLRRLLGDPFLSGVSVVVFDEFHERNLASDLALGMLRQVQQAVRPELKLVVMSATLDPAPLTKYLGDCPAVESEGRTFPVAIEYARELRKQTPADAAVEGVQELWPRISGDLLVFLPGVREIKAAANALRNFATEQGSELRELYGDLSPELQDRALAPSSKRKIILSTNVAETSLTVEGVVGVVDTGVARQSLFDEQTGLDRLELLPISKAAADQRAGRAGRTAPGICLRMWPEAAHRSRPDRETPEVHRVDLSGALLQLACWIEPDWRTFPWFEPPREQAASRAWNLLARLSAVDSSGATKLGRQMADLPTSPRLARLCLEAARLGIPDRGALAAAILAERDPFQRASWGRSRGASHTSDSDLLDRVMALEHFATSGQCEHDCGILQPAAAQAILRSRDALLKAVNRLDLPAIKKCSSDEALLRAALAAYPDRLARRREIASRRALMVGGRGVRLADTSAVDRAELFVCLQVNDQPGESIVSQASHVEREWLDPQLLETRVDVLFDESRGQLQARRRVAWDDLVLDESPASIPKNSQAADMLASAAASHWSAAFPHDHGELQNFIARINLLAKHLPEEELCMIDEAWLQTQLPELCAGKQSLDEVRRANWFDAIRSAFTYQQLQFIDREAPERIEVPSGSKITVQYHDVPRPVLAVKIQELFGLPETPRIAKGRVKLLLHLLAPNGRPQQVTEDLSSFWNNTYQQVRKDLRGRYPKHPWPEDPWTAPATRRAKPRGT